VYAPGAAFFDQIVIPGDFDVALFSWFYGPTGIAGVGAADIFRCGGPNNYTGYCQRLVTSDLDRAEQTLDLGKRAHDNITGFEIRRRCSSRPRSSPVVSWRR
jgi:hypothetical protein